VLQGLLLVAAEDQAVCVADLRGGGGLGAPRVIHSQRYEHKITCLAVPPPAPGANEIWCVT
jgi:hypothetical protein